MKLEELVASEDSSAKLSELGLPDNTIFVWGYDDIGGTKGRVFLRNENYYQYIAAPSAEEILSFIPSRITNNNINPPFRENDYEHEYYFDVIQNPYDKTYLICYKSGYGHPRLTCRQNMSFTDCLAELLIWLVENGYVNFSSGH